MSVVSASVLASILMVIVAGCGGSSTLNRHGSSSSSSSSSSSTTAPRTAPAASSPSSTKTFGSAGIALHFKYPGDFLPQAPGPAPARSAPKSPSAAAAVGIDSYDLLAVSRVAGIDAAPVTAGNLAQRAGALAGHMSAAFHRPMHGKLGSAGGLPAVIWPRVPIPGVPIAATVRVVDVFLGHDQYELECVETAPQAALIGRACRQMLLTLNAS